MRDYPSRLAASRKVIAVEVQGHGHTADIDRPLRFELLAAITSPIMLIVADNDIVRLEHAVEMIHLLGGGIAGDFHGIPRSRLAVIPGTTHAGLCDRAAWVVPMTEEFLSQRRTT